MRYILKNYQSFIRYNTPLFALCMSIVVVSTLLVHFVYGVYQNYNIVQNGNYDQVEGFDEFYFNFIEKGGKKVTKSDMDRCIARISDQMDLIVASGNSDYVILIVYAPLDWNYKKSWGDGNTAVKVAINRFGVAAPDIVFDNMQAYSFTDGSRWTDMQEKEGAQVALFWDYNNPSYQTDGIHPEEAINADNTVTIEGKDYEIIGYQTYQLEPIIPYSSLNQDITFSSGGFAFPEHMSMTSYEILTSILKEELGDQVTFEYPGVAQKDNVNYVYNVVFIVVGLVALIVSVDLLLVYRYYLRKNRHKMAIFRLCGMSKCKNIIMQMGEFLILTLPGYIVSVIFFAFVMLPKLRAYYVYMPNSFTPKVYFIILMIYIICSMVFCMVISYSECRGNVITISD